METVLMTKLSKRIALLMPQILYKSLANFWLFCFRRNIYQAQREYKFTDAWEKFVHINESMNSLKVAFDDWYCFPAGSNQGEAKALKEFCDQNPNFENEPWKNYSSFERSFFVNPIP